MRLEILTGLLPPINMNSEDYALIIISDLQYLGDVPIVTSSSQSVSDVSQKGRDQVYEFIRDELAESIPFCPKQKAQIPAVSFMAGLQKLPVIS
jgi:hypothetical protein